MNYKIALLTLIFAISCVFSQIGVVSYEREDLAVISDSGVDVAHVELTNHYSKVGSKMWLTDCGLTTCYLNLVITPDAPLDARTIKGKVAGGSASYVGVQVYETRVVPVASYKVVERKHTYLDNASKQITFFYNETVFDKYIDAPVAGWYPADKALPVGVPRKIRLEYHKEPWEVADLIPEINGVRLDNWAWWNASFISFQEKNITQYNGAGTYSFNLTLWDTAQHPELRLTTNSSGTETECNGVWQVLNETTGVWIANCSLLNGTTAIRAYYNNNTQVSDIRNVSKACIHGDDFSGAALSALWTSAGTIQVANGSVMLTGNAMIAGTNNRRGNVTLISYSRFSIGNYVAAVALTNHTVAAGADNSGDYSIMFYSYGSKIYPSVINASTESQGATINYGAPTWQKYAIMRNGTSLNAWYINDTLKHYGGTYFTNEPTHPYFSVRSGGYGITDWSCMFDNTMPSALNFTESAWGGEINNTNNNSGPVISSSSLGPATFYKNTSIYCGVNYTDDANSTFEVKQGLMVNGTLIDAFNTTNTAYGNATIWNVSYNVNAYNPGTNFSCWSYANDSASPSVASAMNYTANITMSNYIPVISNVQITNPLQNGTNATGTADFFDYENHTIACVWTWYVNNIAVNLDVQTPICTNTSYLDALNYTIGDLVNFTVGATDSYGDVALDQYSATINVSPSFSWNNYTWTGAQYESVQYAYTANFTMPVGNTLNFANLHYNGQDFTASCANTSSTYYCSYTGLPAPLVSANGTAFPSYWLVNYTTGATTVELNQTFTPTVYYGFWAVGMNSSTIVAGGGPASVNVFYSNASGTTATLSGLAWFLTSTANSGALTCAAGVCAGSITTPSVSYATIYQVEANLTLASSFWGATQDRVVRVENTYYATAQNSTNTSSGTVTNPANGWDLNWSSYASMGVGGVEYFNYTFAQLYNGNFSMRDFGASRSFAIPADCLRPTISLRVQRSGAALVLNYSCWNYSSEGYSTIYTTGVLAVAYFYEQNMTLQQNNSMVKVVPFGLTNCSIGVPLIYYSCWDETTGGSLTCDYEQTFILNTTSGNSLQTFNGTDDNWTICFYPSTLVGNLSSTEEITATGYDTRFFYIFGTAFNSSVSFNETRWVGPSATTKLTFIYVKRAGVGEPGVYVYVERLFIANNTFKTVGMGKTNDDGTAVTYLEPNDAFYKFVVVDGTGAVLYTSSTQQVGCAATASSCSVTLNIENSVVDFWDYQDGMATNCSFDTTTKIVACSFVVLDGTSHYFQLDVYRWAQFGNKTLNCTKNTTSSAGMLWCDLGDASSTGTFVYYLTSYTTGLILQEGTFNWMALASWGTTGLFIALILVAIMAWVGTNFGPSMTILLAYVGFAVSWLFQFVNVDLLAMVGLGVVAGALMYVIKH